VVFEPQQAAEFIAGISSAVNGLLVHKKSSFLGALLGKTGRLARSHAGGRRNARARIATRPFDGEGVASRRTAVIGTAFSAIPLRRYHRAQGQGEEHRQRIPSLGQPAFDRHQQLYLRPARQASPSSGGVNERST